MKQELPELNNRVFQLINEFCEGNVSEFARQIGVKQQTIDRLFKIDRRTEKFPRVKNEIADVILSTFKRVNKVWLLTGDGKMFNDPELISFDNHPFTPNEHLQNNTGTGVPYYDIDVTASLTESFSDVKEEPEFYVDFRPFNDCTAYLPVFGDSMYPLITSGEIVALKKVINPEYIQYGEPHLIITNAEANNMRTLKIIRKHLKDDMIILKPVNPLFDEMTIPRKTILSLYIVKGKITRRQL